MWLRSLQADRLRNLKTVAVELSGGVTLVTGRNGQGKTSLLESAYLLGTGHSFRTRKLDDVVSWNGGPLRAAGRVEGLHGGSSLAVVVDGGLKHLFVDGAERDLDAFLGRLAVVALTGEAMRTLREGPEERRRFVDAGVAGVSPGYLRELADYRRTLAERNALLRRATARRTAPDAAEIGAWDERLAAAGARVHRRRRAYVVGLASRLGPAERALFPEGGAIGIGYRPSPSRAGDEDPGRFADVFRAALERCRSRDRALGFTTVGPHRDDVRATLGTVDLRRFGSAGQLRAAMVALSAGKLAILKESRGEAPLFLMDDFDSDLDEGRARSLLEFLRGGGFQALLATSKDGFVDRLGLPLPRIRVDGGVAREV